SGDRLTLRAGRLAGIEAGDLLDIYRPDDPEPILSARVARADFDSATLDLPDTAASRLATILAAEGLAPEDSPLWLADRAPVLTAIPAGRPARPVRIAAPGTDPALLDRLTVAARSATQAGT